MQIHKPDARKIVHMHPYHYSLIHHSLGVPISSMQPPLYHLDIDHQGSTQGAITGEGGIMGTKMSHGQRDKNAN
jgi:hypothetical protein